jgi:hypothetical protein
MLRFAGYLQQRHLPEVPPLFRLLLLLLSSVSMTAVMGEDTWSLITMEMEIKTSSL